MSDPAVPCPPTLHDLSRVLGYSTYSISCALRGTGRVAPVKREEIQRAARRMGYLPNAAASILSRKRHRTRSTANRMVVAGLGFGRLRSPGLWTAFERACAETGFEAAETPDIGHATPNQLLKVLWSRGVAGIYLVPSGCRWSAREIAEADWTRFAVVKRNRLGRELPFHLVRLNVFDYMTTTLQHVFDAGRKHVAVLLSHNPSAEDDFARASAVLGFREWMLPRGGTLRMRRCREMPSAPMADSEVAKALKWFGEVRPDAAVISPPHAWIEHLRKSGCPVPGDVGLATPLAPRARPGELQISGCLFEEDEIARRAVARLFKLIESGERGIPSHPTEDIIQPIWVDGDTMNPRRSGPGYRG